MFISILGLDSFFDLIIFFEFSFLPFFFDIHVEGSVPVQVGIRTGLVATHIVDATILALEQKITSLIVESSDSYRCRLERYFPLWSIFALTLFFDRCLRFEPTLLKQTSVRFRLFSPLGYAL